VGSGAYLWNVLFGNLQKMGFLNQESPSRYTDSRRGLLAAVFLILVLSAIFFIYNKNDDTNNTWFCVVICVVCIRTFAKNMIKLAQGFYYKLKTMTDGTKIQTTVAGIPLWLSV